MSSFGATGWSSVRSATCANRPSQEVDPAGRPSVARAEFAIAMFDMPVRSVMQRRKILQARPDTVVSKLARLMAKINAGAVLIVEDTHLIGIFTERDVVFRVVARGLDARTTRVADVMTPAPQTVAPDKPFGYALMMMHRNRFRHLPVVENGKVIGIVSARSAMDPELEEFVSEVQRRKHLLGES
jgi:CBS domain-containing protein